MKLTPFAKFFITVVILGVIGYAGWRYKSAGFLDRVVPAAKQKESKVPLKADLPSLDTGSPGGSSAKVDLPGSTPGNRIWGLLGAPCALFGSHRGDRTGHRPSVRQFAKAQFLQQFLDLLPTHDGNSMRGYLRDGEHSTRKPDNCRHLPGLEKSLGGKKSARTISTPRAFP